MDCYDDRLQAGSPRLPLIPPPGKINVERSKPAKTATRLALVYSPGVAEPVRESARDRETVCRYTGKGSLVAVITNGSTILGLGNPGPLLASRR